MESECKVFTACAKAMVHVQDVVVADQCGQLVAGALQTRLDPRNENRAHVLADFVLHLFFRLLLAAALAREDELVVLRRDDDRMHAQRLVRRLVVLDRDLRLRVGTQIGHHLAFAADDGDEPGGGGGEAPDPAA